MLANGRLSQFGFGARRIATSSTPTTMYPPANWKAKAPLSLPGPTFAAQARLPKLPVPELEQTLRKLKDSLKPIAHHVEEYDAAVAKVDHFAKGLGPKLHERLLKRREETDHWLEEWWDNDAYLAYRDSVVVNVSYFCECFISVLFLRTGSDDVVRWIRGSTVATASDFGFSSCQPDQRGDALSKEVQVGSGRSRRSQR